MKREFAVKHEFVEFIPELLEEGVFYISIPYATASHKCFCGCGMKVVTPISPTDWKLTFDGKTISLHPSVGSWSLPCRSHYWIAQNKVRFAEQWTDEEIQANRLYDSQTKQKYYSNSITPAVTEATLNKLELAEAKPGLLSKLTSWWRS